MGPKKEEFEDDGRTICNMDVEGMPDHLPFRFSRQERREDRDALKMKMAYGEPMTSSEYRRYTWYAILAALTVLGVIGGGVILFILILWLYWG